MIQAALTYVADRNRWLLMDSAERRAFDARRTRDHNNFMATLTPLGRYCQQTWGTDWLAELGTPEHDRKRFGDFAGYIVLFGNLQAR